MHVLYVLLSIILTGEKPPKPVASPQVATEDAAATNAEATPSTEDKVETNKQWRN